MGNYMSPTPLTLLPDLRRGWGHAMVNSGPCFQPTTDFKNSRGALVLGGRKRRRKEAP